MEGRQPLPVGQRLPILDGFDNFVAMLTRDLTNTAESFVENGFIGEMPIRDEPEMPSRPQSFRRHTNKAATDIGSILATARMKWRVRHDHIVGMLQARSN